MREIRVENILAVGVDAASRTHRAVAMVFPEQIVLDLDVHNCLPGFEDLSIKTALMFYEAFP